MKARSRNMYSVIMKNGKVINVDANSQDMLEDIRILKLYNGVFTVGVFNMDNIVGFVKSNHMAESDD
jgi:hypothetical protein